jgi:glycosyltransferase involved in cell wall biosynthesis
VQKGQDLLLEAWPAVSEQVPEAQLAIVGDGPTHDVLVLVAQTIAKTTDSVHLYGASEVPEDWYAAADVVVVPSRWEGMALVPLEAMACERSVIGFDVAGLAESVGDAGAVVRCGDVAGLARAMTERLVDRNHAAREGSRGRARAVTLYDRQKAVAVTDEAIRTLLTQMPRARRASH